MFDRRKILPTRLVIAPVRTSDVRRSYKHRLADTPAAKRGRLFFAVLRYEEETRLRSEALKRWRKEVWEAEIESIPSLDDWDFLRQIWNKAKIIPHVDPNEWRWDVCGATISYSHYCKKSKYGWAIDHIRPVALGGSDELRNLRPLHHLNNSAKGKKYPWHPSKGCANWYPPD